MLKRSLQTALILSPLFILFALPILQAQTPVSEDAKTRLNKQETLAQMTLISRLPQKQRENKISGIWLHQEAVKTPRSDFLFCMGFAYLGNHKAQACVADAYEKGLGIVEDLMEAYTWYAVALEYPISDAAAKQRIEENKERIKQKLVSVYPAPTDDELDDLVRKEKDRIAQYQEAAKKLK
jgi:hypothetical protein